MDKFTANESKSEGYFKKLNSYMKKNVKGCVYDSGKKLFSTHPSVGECYALKRNGKPFRVLIFGMEVSQPEKRKKECNMHDRTKKITSLGKKFNPHMRGTLYTLQLLFGLNLSYEELEMPINKNKKRILGAFALSNSILYNTKEEKFRKDGVKHFKRTIEILEPQIIILQGGKPERSFNDAFFNGSKRGDENRYNENMDKAHIDTIKINDKPVLSLSLYHPSNRLYKRPPNKPYNYRYGQKNPHNAKNYVKPAIRKLLEKYNELHK